MAAAKEIVDAVTQALESAPTKTLEERSVELADTISQLRRDASEAGAEWRPLIVSALRQEQAGDNNPATIAAYIALIG